MIINSNQISDAREALESSIIAFYLTGSRFFGNAREDSDWDFFTDDTPVTRDFLRRNGFLPTLAHTYLQDQMITAVYERDDVDVQLCFDVTLKNKIQERMKAADIYPTRSDWRLAFILMRD